jgi:hypothetical protein
MANGTDSPVGRTVAMSDMWQRAHRVGPLAVRLPALLYLWSAKRLDLFGDVFGLWHVFDRFKVIK